MRIADGKDRVVVLDFIADIRRLAAIKSLDNAVHTDGEVEELSDVTNTEYERNNIVFTDQRCQDLIIEWIKDIADLENQDQEAILDFPHIDDFDVG